MLRSNGDPVKSPHRQAAIVCGRVVGAAAANPTIPADTRGDNNVLSTNRSGVGLFTVTFKKEVNLAVNLAPNVVAVGPTVTAHVSAYTAGTATTGAIVGIRFTTDAGVAADMTTGDTLFIELVGRDSAT
jgi:hypothetical protein